MLPTPGNKSVRLEMTIKMKNDIANGKTHLTTFGSSTLPIKPSQPSISASITFCPLPGTSFISRCEPHDHNNQRRHNPGADHRVRHRHGPMLNSVGRDLRKPRFRRGFGLRRTRLARPIGRRQQLGVRRSPRKPRQKRPGQKNFSKTIHKNRFPTTKVPQVKTGVLRAAKSALS